MGLYNDTPYYLSIVSKIPLRNANISLRILYITVPIAVSEKTITENNARLVTS